MGTYGETETVGYEHDGADGLGAAAPREDTLLGGRACRPPALCWVPPGGGRQVLEERQGVVYDGEARSMRGSRVIAMTQTIRPHTLYIVSASSQMLYEAGRLTQSPL